MTNTPQVVLYHYDGSPFATKVKNMLLHKGIPHKRVAVGMTLPRPELSAQLGVTYRRIPVLAIGSDVYCDTNLIAAVLERRFPPARGFPTLFPARAGAAGRADTGLARALVRYWSDGQLFYLLADSLPYARFDVKFIKDRTQFRGGPIDAAGLAAKQGARSSALSSHMTLIEEQLSDGREWLLDTEAPGLADLGAHFLLDWGRAFKNLRDLYDPAAYPKTLAWLQRVSAHLEKARQSNAGAFEKTTGEEAAKIIGSSPHEDEKALGFDETEAKRIGVKLGDIVSITPADTGKVPTVGPLLALNRTEVVIETKGSAGKVHVHFPRLGFTVESAQASAKL